MITGSAGLAVLYCRSVDSSSGSVTGNVSRKMVPSAVIVTAFVCGLARAGAWLAFGRLTLMPCTDAVVMMMKITIST